MEKFSLDIINHILSFRPTHPVALLVKDNNNSVKEHCYKWFDNIPNLDYYKICFHYHRWCNRFNSKHFYYQPFYQN